MQLEMETLLLQQFQQINELSEQFTSQFKSLQQQLNELQHQLNDTNRRLTLEPGTALQQSTQNESITSKLPDSLPCRNCLNAKATTAPVTNNLNELAKWQKKISTRVVCLLTHHETYDDSDNKLLLITDCSKFQKVQ